MKFYKLWVIFVSLFVVLGFLGCGDGDSSSGGGTGTLSLSLTDAPLADEDNVTGIYITITEIQYHTQGGWKTMKDFNTSVNPINLLDWQDGDTISLGDFQMPAGKYTQLRFMLDAADESQKPKSNTGCYIEFDGDRNETLYVPSGSQTGYKGIGNYEVPVNGNAKITADFNVRKSVVVTGNGADLDYKLKPTIRLIATNEAGKIIGTVSDLNASKTYGVYAYGTNESMVSDEPVLDEAITSALIRDDGSYTIAFLAAGTYDLAIVEYGDNVDIALYSWLTNIEVISGEITENIDIPW